MNNQLPTIQRQQHLSQKKETDFVLHFYEDVKTAYANKAKGIHRLY